MFCTSLRKRREWAAVPQVLLALPQPRWQERDLGTHDLALPLPRKRHEDRQEFFHLLLLSQLDVEPIGASVERIQRLYHQAGGHDVGIIFLLKEQPPAGNGAVAFLTLQASLVSTFDIPILPLSSVSTLQTTLFTFQTQLVLSRSATCVPQADPRNTLLPYCSTHGQLSEHAINVLSDSCHSISDLAQAATSPEGKEHVRRYLSYPSPLVAEGIIGFWETEYVLD